MRVWDLPPKILCRQHLLGQHNEIHAIWTVITENKKGYSNHPETKRWKGKLKALYLIHERTVTEMESRRYKHNSNLDQKLATGSLVQNVPIDSLREQRKILKSKKCTCLL